MRRRPRFGPSTHRRWVSENVSDSAQHPLPHLKSNGYCQV
jgi:hypothetical protein